MTPPPELPGEPRTALVTGAGSGIGAACAARFLADGWSVIGWDVRRGEEARVAWAEVDVSDWDAVEAAAASVPPLAAVVNCAGIALMTPTLSMRREDWDRTIAINLNGAYYVSRHLYEPLRRAGGVLVQVASVNAKNTTRFRAAESKSFGKPSTNDQSCTGHKRLRHAFRTSSKLGEITLNGEHPTGSVLQRVWPR